MELYCECRHICIGDTLTSAVIGIDKTCIRIFGERIHQNFIAVILACDVDTTCFGVNGRLIFTPVTVFEFSCLNALSGCKELMSEAYTKSRYLFFGKYFKEAVGVSPKKWK